MLLGMFAVGRCAQCKVALCGRHGDLNSGALLCGPHASAVFTAQREARERAVEARIADATPHLSAMKRDFGARCPASPCGL